jgi:hypothetical protein
MAAVHSGRLVIEQMEHLNITAHCPHRCGHRRLSSTAGNLPLITLTLLPHHR